MNKPSQEQLSSEKRRTVVLADLSCPPSEDALFAKQPVQLLVRESQLRTLGSQSPLMVEEPIRCSILQREPRRRENTFVRFGVVETVIEGSSSRQTDSPPVPSKIIQKLVVPLRNSKRDSIQAEETANHAEQHKI